MSSNKPKIVSGIKWTSLSTGILSVVGILKLGIAARYLSTTDFATIALATFPIALINLFADAGISNSILHASKVEKAITSSLFWINQALSVTIYCIVFLASPHFARFYEIPELSPLVRIVACSVFFINLGKQHRVHLSKKLRFKEISIIETIACITSLSAMIAMFHNGLKVEAYIYANVIQNACAYIPILTIGLKNHPISLTFQYAKARLFIRIGLFQLGGQICNLLSKDIDILIIGKFFPAETLGTYNLARELVRKPIPLISPIAAQIGAPALALANKVPQELARAFLTLTNKISLVTLPAYGLILLATPFTTWILYGSTEPILVNTIRILAIGTAARMIISAVGSLMIATGRTDLDLKWNLVTLPIVPTAILASNSFGIYAVSTSITIATLCLFYPNWAFNIRRMAPVSFKDYIKAATLPTIR